MGFAVYHMEKGKGGSGGIGRHIDRIESKYGYTTYQHADSSKRELNQEFILNTYCEKPLSKAIEERIKEGYTQEKAIRKDAVKFQTHILTGSHDQMKNIFSHKATADSWIQENINWMCEKYGKENIVRFTLHMDEKTPHLHAVTVPITTDGRISAKSYADGKKALREIQTDYAQRMEQFGLERGLERVGVKHESAQEYYARNKKVDEYMKTLDIKAIEPKKSFLKTNIDEIYKQNQDLFMMVASFTEMLNQQKLELQKLSDVSLQAVRRSRELATTKDRIIEKEVKSRTDIYQREFEEKRKTLLEHRKVLNDPVQLLERIKGIKRQTYKDLLDDFEFNILVEARLKLELGEKVSITDVDDWIRAYAPKEELGVHNPWEALDILTNRDRSGIEDKLYKEIKVLEEELENKKQQQREERRKEQEHSRNRGRRL